jgi:nitrogen fixation protein NifZ
MISTTMRRESVTLENLSPGDLVYAACHIYNDGGIPGIPENTLLAEPGARGVIVETGHLEESPQRKIYLVRFEDSNLNLGPPTGCWAEELSPTEFEQCAVDE